MKCPRCETKIFFSSPEPNCHNCKLDFWEMIEMADEQAVAIDRVLEGQMEEAKIKEVRL